MKTIIRNFISVLRRYKLAAILNVLGLTIAFAAFMVIMMQVDYDRNFDRFHKDADRIYRMDLCMEDGNVLVGLRSSFRHCLHPDRGHRHLPELARCERKPHKQYQDRMRELKEAHSKMALYQSN